MRVSLYDIKKSQLNKQQLKLKFEKQTSEVSLTFKKAAPSGLCGSFQIQKSLMRNNQN